MKLGKMLLKRCTKLKRKVKLNQEIAMKLHLSDKGSKGDDVQDVDFEEVKED